MIKRRKNMNSDFIEINDRFEGSIPSGYDLVMVERTDVTNGTFDSATVLLGFDEIDWSNNDFFVPVVGFLSMEAS
jgi:hypothetical protein